MDPSDLNIFSFSLGRVESIDSQRLAALNQSPALNKLAEAASADGQQVMQKDAAAEQALKASCATETILEKSEQQLQANAGQHEQRWQQPEHNAEKRAVPGPAPE